MTDGTTAPLPKAAPILTLDLGQNGGRLAPTSFAELTTWIQTEQSFWTWALQRHYGNHDQGLERQWITSTTLLTTPSKRNSINSQTHCIPSSS